MSKFDPQLALQREVATFKYIGGISLTEEEAKVADRTVAPRIINTEVGRLLLVAHVRALEIALHGEARTPLPSANHG